MKKKCYGFQLLMLIDFRSSIRQWKMIFTSYVVLWAKMRMGKHADKY